jgi:hypothetical protein
MHTSGLPTPARNSTSSSSSAARSFSPGRQGGLEAGAHRPRVSGGQGLRPRPRHSGGPSPRDRPPYPRPKRFPLTRNGSRRLQFASPGCRSGHRPLTRTSALRINGASVGEGLLSARRASPDRFGRDGRPSPASVEKEAA